VTGIRARSSQQQGQALVAVIVLIALLFLIGTAMTLAVSSSLHTVRQTADDDWRGYAAESASALDLARASDVTLGTSCSGPSPLGSSVNGFALSAMRCPVANISGAGIQRDAVAAQRVASMNCAQPVVGIPLGAGYSAWGTIAWLPNVPDPDIRVLWNDDAACPTWGWGWAGCAVAKSAGFLNFSCDGRFDNDGDVGDAPVAHTLHVIVWGPRAVQLSAVYIRSANAGTDCVVTSIGIAGGAVSERDLVRPACGAPSATSAAFWNRLLP
jgi:hypothetical protein